MSTEKYLPPDGTLMNLTNHGYVVLCTDSVECHNCSNFMNGWRTRHDQSQEWALHVLHNLKAWLSVSKLNYLLQSIRGNYQREHPCDPTCLFWLGLHSLLFHDLPYIAHLGLLMSCGFCSEFLNVSSVILHFFHVLKKPLLMCLSICSHCYGVCHPFILPSKILSTGCVKHQPLAYLSSVTILTFF